MSTIGDTADASSDESAKSRPWDLRARLFILVLLAILPALAIQAYHEIELRRPGEAEVRVNALAVAKFASGELERIVENGHGRLVAFANLPAVRNQDASECSAYADALNKAFPTSW